MKTAGIIVEYNPFHNGHQFHLERTRRETGADFIVAVMSGDFVQRGAPALTDKYIRTRMALMGGADLVLELPVLFSLGSAGDFAAGAVSLLDKLGVVDALCFGSESGTILPFQNAAVLLADEPPAFSSLLQEKLKQGYSFPHARAEALQSCLNGEKCGTAPHPVSIADGSCANTEELSAELLSSPNNILGLEYCAALYKRKSAIRPVTIKREGSGYHDPALSCGDEPGKVLSSAQAIRRALQPLSSRNAPFIDESSRSASFIDGSFRNVSCPDGTFGNASPWDTVAQSLPRPQWALWKEILGQNRLLFPEDFTKELRYRLILEQENGFTQYADVTRELSDKIKKDCLHFSDWNALCDSLKSKELTYSRISRALCHILLSVTADELQEARERDYVPYARILGFRQSALPMLSGIKQNGGIPLLSKLADARRLLSGQAFQMLQKDVLAAHLYESCIAAKTGVQPLHEYTRQIISF